MQLHDAVTLRGALVQYSHAVVSAVRRKGNKLRSDARSAQTDAYLDVGDRWPLWLGKCTVDIQHHLLRCFIDITMVTG